ncbi:hypothetical protein GO495_15930 [Chitinophaga oryziterrae]|uniref:Uncharacterized protein n=1 Tax=Chitinophaga oryziterrae TaxID=1031224 RepID=A0A6N8JC15_9BACT|nr:hypothetical protein [Chitinophaga oryziterrae]MVT42081.1 hypothetical protein [Chitinophaga oryziterrae]
MMLINRLIAGKLFMLLLSMLPLVLLGQSRNYIRGRHIFVAIDDGGIDAQHFLKENEGNIGVVKMIYGTDIYPDNPTAVNIGVFKAAIVKAFPGVNDDGIGVLDWEGKAVYILANSAESDPDYVKVLNEFTKAIRFAKSIRPNVMWGFFGIPFRRRIFKNDEAWVNSNDKIAPLLRETDAFFPALYSSYSIAPDIVQKGNLKRGESIFSKDTREALRLALAYNKIVLPFIWHRYEINDKEYRDKVIPKVQFRNMVNDIVNASYSGKKVDGIVWWSKDTYFYSHKNAVVSGEAPNLKRFQIHYDSLIINYGNEIKKIAHK